MLAGLTEQALSNPAVLFCSVARLVVLVKLGGRINNGIVHFKTKKVLTHLPRYLIFQLQTLGRSVSGHLLNKPIQGGDSFLCLGK